VVEAGFGGMTETGERVWKAADKRISDSHTREAEAVAKQSPPPEDASVRADSR
jgi:hypothetical protein